MTRLSIRQSGGANIVSIPKAILKSLDLHPGSSLELSIKDHQIVLTPVQDEVTLATLLAGSPQKNLAKIPEDSEWLNSQTAGKEE